MRSLVILEPTAITNNLLHIILVLSAWRMEPSLENEGTLRRIEGHPLALVSFEAYYRSPTSNVDTNTFEVIDNVELFVCFWDCHCCNACLSAHYFQCIPK